MIAEIASGCDPERGWICRRNVYIHLHEVDGAATHVAATFVVDDAVTHQHTKAGASAIHSPHALVPEDDTMAGIRKVDAQQIRRTEVKAPEAEAPKALSPSELSQILAKAFGNLILHGNELPALEKALKQAGPHAADFQKNIERRLADPNIKVSPQSLDKLQSLGIDVSRARETIKKNTDLRTTEKLGQTETNTVADKVTGEAAAQNAVDKHAAIQASHAGRAVAKNELSPEFKLAKQLTGDVAGRIWADKAPPELKAMGDAIGPQVSSLAQQTAMSVMSDPNAMANISQLVSKMGQEGFTKALASSTKDISGHFLNSAGVQAKNPEAIKAALGGIEKLAPKVGGSLGEKMAETASKLGPKLLGEGAGAAAQTGAAAAKTAAQTGAAAAKTAQVAGGAAKAAVQTAGTATKVAATGAKALPVIGNIVSVGSTLLAGASLLSQLTKKPRDVEKILKEGVNTLTQGVGIAFPWVALGGTLTDAAWSAKLSVSDQKKAAAGIPVTENANVLASLPLLTDAAQILQSGLAGAGKHDAAEKVGNLVTTTKTMAKLDLNNPGDRIAMMRKDQQAALVALAHETKAELEAASNDEATGTRKESLMSLAKGFGALADTVLATSRFDKREASPGFDDKAKKDLEVKRNELAGNLVKQLGELGYAELLRRGEAATTTA